MPSKPTRKRKKKPCGPAKNSGAPQTLPAIDVIELILKQSRPNANGVLSVHQSSSIYTLLARKEILKVSAWSNTKKPTIIWEKSLSDSVLTDVQRKRLSFKLGTGFVPETPKVKLQALALTDKVRIPDSQAAGRFRDNTRSRPQSLSGRPFETGAPGHPTDLD